MKIVIVGNGNIGAGLARAWVRHGHTLVFGARDPGSDKLRALCTELGASAQELSTATGDADVVVLAMPYRALDEVLATTGDLSGQVVIDCTNAVAKGMKLEFSHEHSTAEDLQKRLPTARVVKSFNAQGAENLANPVYDGIRASNYLCGDDPAARALVSKLVEQVGFEAIDVGALSQARLLEPLMLLWIASAQAAGTRDVAFKLLRR